tara:strand:- start:2658 stop:3050 length:393 start_codon:yes stop_codon:yes gene_type:complete
MKYDTIKISLRLKIDDFIQEPLYSMVMDMLSESEPMIKVPINYVFYYEDLKTSELKKFIKDAEAKLKNTTFIKRSDMTQYDHVWFDIRKKQYDLQSFYAFEYDENNVDIVLGISQFRKAAKFVTSEKPKK